MRSRRVELVLSSVALAAAGYALGRLVPRLGSPQDDIRPAPRPLERLQSPRKHRWLALAAAGILCGAGGYGLAVQSPSQGERLGHALTGGDPRRAPPLLRRYGCGGCHTIPGLAGADGKTAAPLGDLVQRVFIGGVARNSPDNLVRWIVSPQSLSPRSAMPATGITPDEARDVAAFLYAR